MDRASGGGGKDLGKARLENRVHALEVHLLGVGRLLGAKTGLDRLVAGDEGRIILGTEQEKGDGRNEGDEGKGAGDAHENRQMVERCNHCPFTSFLSLFAAADTRSTLRLRGAHPACQSLAKPQHTPRRERYPSAKASPRV